jgi:hypothetical protein
MMRKIPLKNIYIMTMDGFVRNAAHEVEMLLNWLDMYVIVVLHAASIVYYIHHSPPICV